MNTTPYIIGITGHRDLDESATNKVHQHLLGFLTNIKKQLQNTPIIILSGMADGADRIIVKVALELELNIKALMPMPGKEYCKDFSEASYKEFRQLCKSENVVVEVVEQIHQLDKGQEINGQDRDNQYWVLGQYLINHVNLLVAVWDGQNTGYTGGTSDVLLDYLEAKPRRKQDRIDNKAHQITLVEDNQQQPLVSRFVYWLKVDKTEHGHSVDGSLQSCFLSGKESKYTFQKFEQPPTCLLADILHIDEYNEKVCELLEENKISDDYSLLNDYDLKKSPIPKEMLKKLDEEFLKADAVAVHNQKYSDSQFATFSLMAAMMGILFLVYAKIVASKILLIGYLLLFFFGWRYYKHAEKANRFTKHLTARALAETLRTQFYLTLIGRGSNTKPTHLITHSGVGQFPGFNWIKQVILANVPIYLDNKKTRHYCQYNIEFVCQYWISEQAQYFQNKTKRLAKHHHKLERIKSLLFIGSALMALALVLFKYQLMAIVIYQQVDAKVLTVLLMGLLPFLLGVWEIYQNKMAVKELLWQYQNQRSLFENALEHINHAKDIEHKYMVIQELADRALLENYIWIIHRFHREQEPPTAG